MNPSLPSSATINRLTRRNFIQYSSIYIASSLITACANNNQPSTNSSGLEKVTSGTNWIAQAEHGGFYQAMSTTGCAYATGIYQDYNLDVTIKMGGFLVGSGTQLLMGDAVDFFMGYGIDAVNAIAQGIPKITVAAIFQKDPWCLIAHPNTAIKTLGDLKLMLPSKVGIAI